MFCVLLCLPSLVYGMCCRTGNRLSSVLLCLINLATTREDITE
jgi:hypothetical protein